MNHPMIYGVLAEFDDPGIFVQAAREVREKGYKRFEAYTPYPVKALDEIVPGGDPVPAMVFGGGVVGAGSAWLLQYYIAAIDYPINVGGRPLYSWPSFIPITFELTVLFASLAAFFGTLWLCGLPLLHHPVFNWRKFAEASRDRFFLCIEARDPRFGYHTTADFLLELGALEVREIENE